MSQTPIKIEYLRELINKGEASDPLVFLESVMNGQDPRRNSKLYELACEINDFSGGSPEPEEWAELFDFITTHFVYHTVSLAESTNAATTLAQYLYAKRKQVDSDTSHNSGSIQDSPLTAEDIELFKEKFEDEF